MRKEKMVTRTMDITSVKAMAVLVETAQVEVQEFTLIGEYTKESALKKLKEQEETDELKIVAIQDMEHWTQLMGMSEYDFYIHSEILPDR